jgi:YD repeat-containing protein
VVTYTNDTSGRVISVTYPDRQEISYVYDNANAVTEIEVTAGASSLIVADYLYDNMGRVTDKLLGDGGSTSIASLYQKLSGETIV